MKLSLHSDVTYYLSISIVMLLSGILFYGFYNNYIIIRWPTRNVEVTAKHPLAHRRQVRLYYWNGKHLIYEDKKIIFSSDVQLALSDLTVSWLSFLYEEEILSKKIAIQAGMVDEQKQIAYISLNQSPFRKNQSTFEKLMMIEGLLKTVQESKIPITRIQFLVHHSPLNDYHLDFTHPWPVTGYLSLSK